MKSVVVIGGGISGLAAAHRLLERNQDSANPVNVTLLEAGPRVGGIIESESRDGFLLERGPDSFISEKPQALNLAQRLGLQNHLIQTNSQHRRSFIVRNASLRPVPEGFQLLAPGRLRSFLASDIFSWKGKARIALDMLLPRGRSNGASDESLAQFVKRRLGREALERMAQPMVGGIYTADPEMLSLRATMPRFLEMEREHRSLILAMRRNGRALTTRETGDNEAGAGTSGARYSLFLSFDAGMQLLTDSLEKRIGELCKAQSSREPVLLNSPVQSMAFTGETGTQRWRITTSSGETFSSEAVCLALPAFVSARLLRDADSQLASELDTIPYASSATINLAYKRADIPHPLDGFGFVVPFVERRSIMACTFSSVKFENRAPNGHVLLRVFVGGALQPEMVTLGDQELLSKARNDLRELLGIEREPMWFEISRWDRSMPQYHVGHLDRIRRIRDRLTSLPGLALAGNAYTGLGIPDCITSGENAANDLLATLESERASDVAV